MTDLDTRVRQAFDNVTVPDDVKRGTLTYIASIAEASGVSAETAPASAAAPRKHARAQRRWGVIARCRVAYGSRVCGRSQPPHAKRCVLALCARGLVH